MERRGVKMTMKMVSGTARIYLSAAMCAVLVLVFGIRSGMARPIDQDYYTVDRYPDIKALLQNVDYHHTRHISRAIQERNLGAAKNDLEYTLVTFPNHPEALQMLWFYAKVTKSPAFALPYFDKAVRMFPQYAMTHFLYGAFLTDFSLLKEAERELKKAIEFEPALAIAHAWLAKMYDKAGDNASARSSAEKAVQLGYRGTLLEPILGKTSAGAN